MERLTNVKLYGKLGARFGRVHRLAVSSPAEAVKALSVMIDGFESFLLKAKENGMVFTVFVGTKNITEDDYAASQGVSDIRIAPVMEGAKKAGTFQTVLGVALIAAAVFAPWGAAIVASNIIGGIGVSLAAGGVVQLLTPQQKGLQSRQDPDNKPSYAFGGAVNTTASGNVVSVLWGEREIGGAIISAAVIAEDM